MRRLTTKKQLLYRVAIVTWNMAGRSPPHCDWLSKFADVDVVVVGMQEFDPQRQAGRERLQHAVEAALKKKKRRNKVVEWHQQGPVQLAVFARPSLDVSVLSRVKVACGVGKVLPNKGAACSLLGIGAKGAAKLALIATHLPAHASEVKARNEGAQKIFDCARGEFDDDDSNYWVCFGDLNYRLAQFLRRSEVILATEDESTWELLNHDQLTQERAAGRTFRGMTEPPLAFPPTYKFDDFSDTYDSSVRRRTPAWTDRILLHGGCLVHSYDYVPSAQHSDHRPVVAILELPASSCDDKGNKKKKKRPPRRVVAATTEDDVPPPPSLFPS